MHELRTVVTDVPLVWHFCQFVQKLLHGLRFSLGWQLLGTQGTLLDVGPGFPHGVDATFAISLWPVVFCRTIIV